METRTPVPTSGIRGWCVCIVRAAGAEHFCNRIVLCIARRLGCAKSCARVSARRLLSHNGYGTTFLIFIIIIVIIILSRPGANPMLCTSICVAPFLSLSLVWCGSFVSLLFFCCVCHSLSLVWRCCFSVVFADDHYVCSLSSKLRRHGSSVAGLLCSRPMAHGDTKQLKAPAVL